MRANVASVVNHRALKAARRNYATTLSHARAISFAIPKYFQPFCAVVCMLVVLKFLAVGIFLWITNTNPLDFDFYSARQSEYARVKEETKNCDALTQWSEPDSYTKKRDVVYDPCAAKAEQAARLDQEKYESDRQTFERLDEKSFENLLMAAVIGVLASLLLSYEYGRRLRAAIFALPMLWCLGRCLAADFVSADVGFAVLKYSLQAVLFAVLGAILDALISAAIGRAEPDVAVAPVKLRGKSEWANIGDPRLRDISDDEDQ